MSTTEERRARGFQAKLAYDEFVAPAIDGLRADYMEALSRLAVNEPWASDKLVKLAVAQRVINTVEQHMKAIILDGEVAAKEKSRADEIANLPEAKRRWLNVA